MKDNKALCFPGAILCTHVSCLVSVSMAVFGASFTEGSPNSVGRLPDPSRSSPASALRLSSLYFYFRLQLCSCTQKLWAFVLFPPAGMVVSFAKLTLTQPSGLKLDVPTSRKLSLTVLDEASVLCVPLAPCTWPSYSMDH